MKVSLSCALFLGQLLRPSAAQAGNERVFTAEDLCEGGDACPPFTNSSLVREEFLAEVGLLVGGTNEESFEVGYDVLDENQFVENLIIRPMNQPLGDAGIINVTGEIGIYNKVAEGQAGQRFATDGQHYMRIKSSSTTRFNLQNDVNAIGFYLTDVGDWNSTAPTLPTEVTTSFQGGNIKIYFVVPDPDPLLANGNAIFWGIIDTEPFDAFAIRAANNDAIGLDQFVVQSTVAPTSTAPVAPTTPTTAAPVSSAPVPPPSPPVSKGKGFVLQSKGFYPVNVNPKSAKSGKGKGYYYSQNFHFWQNKPAPVAPPSKGKGVITKGVAIISKGVEIIAKGKGVEIIAKGKGVEIVAKGKGVVAKGLPPNYYYKSSKSAKTSNKYYYKNSKSDRK